MFLNGCFNFFIACGDAISCLLLLIRSIYAPITVSILHLPKGPTAFVTFNYLTYTYLLMLLIFRRTGPPKVTVTFRFPSLVTPQERSR